MTTSSKPSIFNIFEQKGLKREVAKEFDLDSFATLIYNHKLRLVIPIYDLYSRVVGYAFRACDPNDLLPKYINTVFNKSEHLYALNKAYTYILRCNLAIVVEGYFDAIIAHQEGLKNVVAMCGGAVTYQQALLLRRFTSRAIVVYDGDVDLNKKPTFDFFSKFVNVKMQDKDPDEFILQNGVRKFVEYIMSLSDLNPTRKLESKLASMRV